MNAKTIKVLVHGMNTPESSSSVKKYLSTLPGITGVWVDWEKGEAFMDGVDLVPEFLVEEANTLLKSKGLDVEISVDEGCEDEDDDEEYDYGPPRQVWYGTIAVAVATLMGFVVLENNRIIPNLIQSILTTSPGLTPVTSLGMILIGMFSLVNSGGILGIALAIGLSLVMPIKRVFVAIAMIGIPFIVLSSLSSVLEITSPLLVPRIVLSIILLVGALISLTSRRLKGSTFDGIVSKFHGGLLRIPQVILFFTLGLVLALINLDVGLSRYFFDPPMVSGLLYGLGTITLIGFVILGVRWAGIRNKEYAQRFFVILMSFFVLWSLVQVIPRL